MEITTKYLGKLEIDENKIIQFPNGIPGFIKETQFVILDFPDNPIFQILQSVQHENIAFILTNPYLIYRDYSFQLDEAVIDFLGIESEKDVLVSSIVTIKNPFEESTINLKAPIIINPNRMLGKQYILNDEEYPSKAAINPVTTESGAK